jgi:hypothetical protein
MAILSLLWRCGWGLDEIIRYAEGHLHKHLEELGLGRGHGYLLRSLKKVIGWSSTTWNWSSAPDPPRPPSCVCDRVPISGGGAHEVEIDRFIIVRDLVGDEPMPLTDLRQAVVDRFGCTPSTAKAVTGTLLKTGIIVKAGKDALDRRRDLVRRDPDLYRKLCRNVPTWAPQLLAVGKYQYRYAKYQNLKFSSGSAGV